MTKRTAALALTGVLGVLAFLAVIFTVGGPQLAAATCDTGSLRVFAETAARTNDATKRNDMQEAIADCTDLDEFDNQGRGGSSSAPTTTSTSTAPPPPAQRKFEFLANRPAPEKVAFNAFGPQVAMAESNNSKDMDSLTADEAWAEHQFSLKLDPMQTSAAGNTLGFIPGSEVDAKTKIFASDFATWDDMNNRVITRLGEMKREIRVIPAGTPMKMQYALPGETPLVVMDDHVVFPYDIHIIVYTDAGGKEYRFRLKCRFQSLDMVGIPPMPESSPGFTRTPEGTPQKEKPPTSTTTVVTTTTNSTVTTTTPHTSTTTTTPSTTTSTYTCPGGETPPCSKTSAPKPPGQESPTNNPPGTLQPTAPTQTDPLTPGDGQPTGTTSRSTAPPAVDDTATQTSMPPPGS